MNRPADARPAFGALAGRIAVVAGPLLVAFLLARPLVGAPLSTLAVVAALVVVLVLLLRVEWTALVFVAIEPWADYARAVSGAAVKGIGALLVVAWLVHLVFPGLGRRSTETPRRTGVRSGLSHPVALAGIAMVAVALASTVFHSNGSAGSDTLVRYLSFLGALIVLVDLLYTGLPVRRLAAVFVVSCALAGVAGLVAFLGGSARAAGPLSDPNDFAFFMVAALPLALVMGRSARRAVGWNLAAALIAGAMLATLSRGALFAVLAMLIYAVVTGVVKLRVVAVLVALVVVLFAVLSVTNPTLIENSLAQKDTVASQNVDERLARWEVTARMTVDYPVLGIGPGGFKAQNERYLSPAALDPLHPLDVAHETYLEVSAELGLVGLATFLAVLAYGFAGARRRTRLPDASDWLAGGVCAALIGTAVAAIFLTEQYYLPLWMLAAFGAAMDPRHRGEESLPGNELTTASEPSMGQSGAARGAR